MSTPIKQEALDEDILEDRKRVIYRAAFEEPDGTLRTTLVGEEFVNRAGTWHPEPGAPTFADTKSAKAWMRWQA